MSVYAWHVRHLIIPSMTRSTAERLVFWQTLLDRVEDGLAAGVPVVSYNVDGQVVNREPTEEWITAIELRIIRLQQQSSGGIASARNRLRRTRNAY